jgi:hypothetical protein
MSTNTTNARPSGFGSQQISGSAMYAVARVDAGLVCCSALDA